jgi:hypothetical protein
MGHQRASEGLKWIGIRSCSFSGGGIIKSPLRSVLKLFLTSGSIRYISVQRNNEKPCVFRYGLPFPILLTTGYVV